MAMAERRQCPQCRSDVGPYDPACPFCDAVLEKAPPPSAASTGRARRPALEACPDCGATVSVRAASCPRCGCPPRGERRPTVRTPVYAMIGAFAVIVLLNMATADRRGAKAPPDSPRVAPGDRAVLACKGGDGAFVAF